MYWRAGRDSRSSGARRCIEGTRWYWGDIRELLGVSKGVGCQGCIEGLAGTVATQGLEGVSVA